MNVGRAVRDLRLDADEAAGNMAAIEDPIHGVTGKDIRNLLLGGKQDQRRLQQTGADHRRRVRLGHGDGARRIRLKVLRLVACMAGVRGMGSEGKPDGDDDGDGWFHGLWSFRLRSLTLGKARDALGESVLGNQLRPAHPVFRLGGERGVAAAVEIETNNFGESVAAHVQRLAVLQALEESELLFVHLEQLGIPFPVERRVFQKQERRAGVHDAVGVLAQGLRRTGRSW